MAMKKGSPRRMTNEGLFLSRMSYLKVRCSLALSRWNRSTEVTSFEGPRKDKNKKIKKISKRGSGSTEMVQLLASPSLLLLLFFSGDSDIRNGKHQSIGSTAVVRCCLLAWHCWSITTVKLSEKRKRENCTAFAKQKFCSKGKRKSSVALVFVVVCVCVLRKWKGKKRERKEKEKTVTTRLASISDTFGQTTLNTTAANLSPSHTVIGNRSRMLRGTSSSSSSLSSPGKQ